MNNSSTVTTGNPAAVYPSFHSTQETPQQPSQSGTISQIGSATLGAAPSSTQQPIAGRGTLPPQQVGASSEITDKVLSPPADESDSVAATAFSQDPNSSQSKIVNAEVQLKKGDHKQAVDLLTSVTNTDPLYVWAQYVLAKVSLAMKAYSQVFTAVANVPSSDKKYYGEVQAFHAQALYASGRYPEAVIAANRVPKSASHFKDAERVKAQAEAKIRESTPTRSSSSSYSKDSNEFRRDAKAMLWIDR